MPFPIKKGSLNTTRYIMVVDSADGTPETAATITGFDLQFTRFGAAPAAKVDATALASTGATHADNKMIEIDASSSPGLYRVDWPDAAFATGVDGVVLVVTATGFHPSVEIVHLTDYDPQSATNLGLSDITDILADTDDIGVAGAGLTDLGGMSTGMKAEVNIEADGAFATWAPPTKTEMDTAHALLATPAQAETACDAALTTYDAPTKSEMDTAHALLATPAQVAGELGTYAGPTKAEMDTAHALLATEGGGNVAAIKAKTDNLTFTTANKVDSRVDSVGGTAVTAPADLKADVSNLDAAVSTRATPVQVAGELATYAGPTKAEMDTAHTLLATPANVATEISDALTVDTHAELASVPTFPITIRNALLWCATVLRNTVTTTATTQLVKKDDKTTTLGTSTVSDDGTTHERGEFS